MTMMTDTLQEILTAIQNALTDPVGRAQITPGTPAWDDCCSGQLSLWMTGSQTNGARPGCPPVSVTYNLSVQVIRCISTVDNGGRAPSSRQVSEDGLHIIQDMEEVRTAILCDLPSGLGIELGSWLQAEPMGGCSGGTWTFSITLGV